MKKSVVWGWLLVLSPVLAFGALAVCILGDPQESGNNLVRLLDLMGTYWIREGLPFPAASGGGRGARARHVPADAFGSAGGVDGRGAVGPLARPDGNPVPHSRQLGDRHEHQRHPV
ncbi:MAG: hypothetical protein IPL30_07965 [Elusimicrobia bacterium]|nr:hypothetical protein [Elusimicrobiota bacterium]